MSTVLLYDGLTENHNQPFYLSLYNDADWSKGMLLNNQYYTLDR